MAQNYVITAQDNQGRYRDKFNIDAIRTYNFDFTPWAEDNNNLVSVQASVKSGQVSITNPTLTDNVFTAQIGATSSGRSIIQILADTGTEKYSAYLDLFVRDPEYDEHSQYSYNYYYR